VRAFAEPSLSLAVGFLLGERYETDGPLGRLRRVQQPDDGAHDLDVDGDGALAREDRGESIATACSVKA